MSYDYFYNQEAEQYIHYQMPKVMFEREQLTSLSLNAKFLYCLLFDKAKQSYKNGFVDKDGKVYVYFAQKELMEIIGCGRTKISEYFNELDSAKGGIGLIERVKNIGIGKNDKIYVKNFAVQIDENIPTDTEDNSPYAYLHDIDSMRFKHYQIPKVLFSDSRLKQISNTAKMAYSIMLDRTQLSMGKGWLDDKGRVFILFPQKELQQLLGCSIRTVNSALKELDTMGLIDRTRQGMNCPDIIYLLDFATTLKYQKPQTETSQGNNGSDIPDMNVGGANSEHQEQAANIGSANIEQQEVQDLNIGSAKSEHLEVQNLNIGRANSERHIYNNTDVSNTDFNNTDFNDTDFNLSVSPAQTPEQNDRPTDRLHSNRKMTFSDILSEIGISDEYIERLAYWTDNDSNDRVSALSEKNLSDYDFEERKVKSCTIPYSLSDKPKAMEEALKYLFSYSYYCYGMKNEDKRLFTAVISTLAEMATTKIQKYQNQTVKYYHVIDKLNDILHSDDSSLNDWFYSFEQKWTKILAENTGKIKYPKAYMKSCIWNWLNDYQFEEDNDLMALEYELNKQGNIGKKSSISEIDDNVCFVNNIPDTYNVPDTPNITDNSSESSTKADKTPKKQNIQEKITEYSEYFVENFIKKMARDNNKPISCYLAKGTYRIIGDDSNYYVLDDNGKYCPVDDKIGVIA